MKISAKDTARFWSRVEKRSDTECWPWLSYTNGRGYGAFWVAGRMVGAHRIAFTLAVHDPGALDVLHRCDNPPCCNPSHLFDGTARDNMLDAASKRRVRHGDEHPYAKLTNEAVLEIRRKYQRGVYGYCRLAKEFGVHVETIKPVIRRTTWKLAELEVHHNA